MKKLSVKLVKGGSWPGICEENGDRLFALIFTPGMHDCFIV